MSRGSLDPALAPCKGALLHCVLRYPEARLDHPWDEDVLEVRRKIFQFLGVPSDTLTSSMKLPESRFEALLSPFTEPTGYGLGKSGWVTARFTPRDAPPVGPFSHGVDEGCRAVAPRTPVQTRPPAEPLEAALPPPRSRRRKA